MTHTHRSTSKQGQSDSFKTRGISCEVLKPYFEFLNFECSFLLSECWELMSLQRWRVQTKRSHFVIAVTSSDVGEDTETAKERNKNPQNRKRQLLQLQP
jgi:hypothetical protein